MRRKITHTFWIDKDFLQKKYIKFRLTVFVAPKNALCFVKKNEARSYDQKNMLLFFMPLTKPSPEGEAFGEAIYNI